MTEPKQKLDISLPPAIPEPLRKDVSGVSDVPMERSMAAEKTKTEKSPIDLAS